MAEDMMENERSVASALSHLQVDIPFTEYRLANGLRLIVHEDHKAPIVAVNIWYHVGAKNEVEGKTGLAHLFEHLMFNGSEHFNDDYFQALLAIGATDLNGTTSNDRTNYFQNVPVSALDQVLWLESDRMGHLLGALDQSKLDEQRGVVLNEKKQHENTPYGRESEIVIREMFPKGHPYSWPVIGFTRDIENTTVADCHEWFKAYYGAANAVVVVAGDVDADTVRKKVEHYFGDIAPGPAIIRPEVNVPKRLTDTRASYQDRVSEERIVMAWNTPQLGTYENALLTLAASVLSHGKNSRLYKALVYEKQLATAASAFHWSKEIASNFLVEANVKAGVSSAEVESVLNQILNDFLATGPTEDELYRVRAQYLSGFVKGMERIGGFGGKSDILASSAVFGGSPDAYKKFHAYIERATPADIRNACRTWLSAGRFTLTCTPLPDYHVATEGADRSQMPALQELKAGRFPVVKRTKLDNGLEIVLGQRKGTPTVVIEALIKAGFADDGLRPGLASLTMSMLDEGTRSMDALEMNEQLQLLGASLSCAASLDHAFVRLNSLKQTLKQSFPIFTEVLLHPTFPSHELERLKKEFQSAIRREKMNPMPMALRMLPKLLYGKGHRYAQPLTGSGEESSVMSITRDEILQFYHNWIRPENAVILVTGDLELEEAKSMIAEYLLHWKSAPMPVKSVPQDVSHPKNVLYVMDRPGSTQSIVMAGCLIEAYDEETSIATEQLNDVLGGQFISRINMNLREDKHWTYGARSMILDTKGQRPLIAYASVQQDKTLDTIAEIRSEFAQIVSTKPVSEAEFVKNQKNSVLELPGRWETNSAVTDALAVLVKLGLPDDYFQTYPAKLESATISQVHEMAHKLIDPACLSWFVVGDCGKIMPALRTGNFSEIVVLDTDL